MEKRLKHEELEGPNGEIMKVNWMPGDRVRLDFIECGECVVTKLFPSPRAGNTHIEISYGK